MPGTSLKSYFPDKEQGSIEIARRVMKKLHKASIPEDHNFPHIKDWLMVLDRHCEELVTKQSSAGSPRCARDDVFTSSQLKFDKERGTQCSNSYISNERHSQIDDGNWYYGSVCDWRDSL